MLKQFTILLGIVLLGIGVWGYLTGGHDHELIVFGINFTHNLVHILSGILALGAGLAGVKYAKWYCMLFGVVYGLVTVGGFLAFEPVVTMLNLNMADNLLHLVISASCLWMGFTSKA